MTSLEDNLQMLSIQFVPFVMAVVFHEYAHGFMAHRWGDDTAKESGRLTLNPLPHMDPIGTVLFPLINMVSGMNILFGWARPVPIDDRLFKNRRKGLFWVSLAGPGMNFLLAFVSALAYWAARIWMPATFYLYEPLYKMALVSVSLNYALGIFNLIPLPPLDGSKIVQAFLPESTAQKFEEISQYSFFILIALLLSGVLDYLGYPIRVASAVTLYLTGHLFGLPTEVM